MKEDIDEVVELFFSQCLFDPVYMSEKFTKDQIRTALESLSDEEYEKIISIAKLRKE